MKYLKLFENYSEKDIKIGNYVSVVTIHEPTKDFINNNIGKIVDVYRKGIIVDYIKVKFNKKFIVNYSELK